jgi:hypothetical protein
MPTWSLCTSSSKFRSKTLTSTGKKINQIYLIYREQLQNNANKGSYFLKVDMDDLNNFDEQLALTLRSYPSDYIPVVRHRKLKLILLVWKSSATGVQDSLFQLVVRRRRLCALVPSANSQWWESSYA